MLLRSRILLHFSQMMPDVALIITKIRSARVTFSSAVTTAVIAMTEEEIVETIAAGGTIAAEEMTVTGGMIIGIGAHAAETRAAIEAGIVKSHVLTHK